MSFISRVPGIGFFSFALEYRKKWKLHSFEIQKHSLKNFMLERFTLWSKYGFI